MKNIKFTKIIAFFMAVLMILPMIPAVDLTVFAEGSDNLETISNELAANVGKQAIFDWWGSFDVAPDVDSKPGESIKVDDEILGVSGLIVELAGYYYDQVNGYHWYKVEARDGETLPVVLKNNPWVYYETDGDSECGIDPTLCIYEEDEVILFVTSETLSIIYDYDANGEIKKDENGNPIILKTDTLINNYVVSGPSALENATIQINAIDTYPISALSFTETTYGTYFSKGFEISITKSDGSAWSSADGTVAIRYEMTQYGADSYDSDNEYGVAFLYVEDSVYSAEATERYGYEASDVLYTQAACSSIVFEIADPSFYSVNSYGRFSTGTVTLYKNDLTTRKECMLSELPEFVYVAYFFVQTVEITDENGEFTGYQYKEWYWIDNGSEYFFVPQNQITLYDNGDATDEVEEAYGKLMATDTLASYESVLESIDDSVWEALKNTSLGIEIIEHSYLLTYDHYYSAVSEAEYNAIKAQYPDAYNFIQADAELKYFNDLILERVKYLDQHPEERYMQFGEIEYVELPSYTNVAPLVSPTVQVKQPRSAIGAPFAYLRTAANNARAAEDNGVFLSKWATYDSLNKNYKVRLEAYTTGSKVTTVTKTEMPADIILVLDLSSSMVNNSMDAVGYQQITGGTALQGADLADAENLFVMVDGEYREVSVTGSGTTTTTSEKEYSGTRTFNGIQSYLNSGKKLYCKHNDGSYCEIECYIKNNGNNRYTIRCAHGDQVGSYKGNSSNVNLTLYESIPGVTYEKYTYSYEGENGQTVSITYNTNDSIVGGSNPSYYKKVSEGKISRAEALLNAVKSFANEVEQKAKGKDGALGGGDDVPHSIAIVGFCGGGSDDPETGIYIGNKIYSYATGTDRASSVYGEALQDMATAGGVSNINGAIANLDNGSGTYTYCGTEMAEGILAAYAQEPNRYVNEKGETIRSKVVVVFTDGAPNGTNAYDAPVDDCYRIKNTYNATVYSVGILDGGDATYPATGNTSQMNRFMHAMSSNYRYATGSSLTAMGDPTNDRYEVDGSNYYLLASNADDLNNIFGSISQNATTGGSITDLSTETQIRDIISPYFKLPDGANTDHIKLYTANYIGQNTFGGDNAFPGSVTISDDGKTIGVTGFDYAENWVGTETDAGGNVTFHGQKLIIEFTIVPDPLFLGGTGVATNGADSGIYPDSSSSEVIENFNVPTVDVPLKSIDTVAKDRHIYWSNSVDLTDILNLHVTETSSAMLLQDIANGVNNAFVDLVYYVTLANNTIATYTIPAGTLWNAGTWSYPYGTLDMKALILDANTSYGIECVMTDIKNSSNQMRAPASGTSLATVYVYKPVLTFKDSEQTYRKPLNPTSSSIDAFINSHWENIVWKRADGKESTDVTMSGSTPQVGIVYQYDTTAFTADLKMNSVRDVPVNVTVTITGTGKVVTITQGDAFQHSNCSHPGCAFNPATEEFIVHVVGALTSLKIQKVTKNKNGASVSFENIDPNQTFLFRVMGKDADGQDIDVTVTVHAKDGFTIVDGLVIGNQYTVQELTDWSWRYTCKLGAYTNDDGTNTSNSFVGNTATLTITALGELNNVATFENTRNTEYWLDGDSWCDNRFMANVTQAIN